MSGTSLDGVDAALVSIEPRGRSYALELLHFITLPFDDELSRLVREVLPPETPAPALVADVSRRLGSTFARAARNVSGGKPVAYVASHGLTLYHDGAHALTMQIGDPFVMREVLATTICYDFRSADCAVGGHGAPLVPYVDALLLASPVENRVALNLGGVANITALPRDGAMQSLLAFDTGPGNLLIDSYVHARSKGKAAMDEDGALAASGTVNELLLETLLAEPYFAQPPPKSTGRETFGMALLDRHRDQLERLAVEDALATLTELTARTVAEAIASAGLADAHIFASGGGTRNLALMRRLSVHLPKANIEPSDAAGLPVDAKEAMAFAVLGYETLRERAANVPSVTGAARAIPLGAIAPWRLRELLADVDAECR